MTPNQLARIIPCPLRLAQRWCSPLVTAMEQGEIITIPRQTAFLGQVGVESDSLRAKEEYASGAAYERRKDLGNTRPGDGRKFKGHGLIQVTGRTNHTVFARYYFRDTPDLDIREEHIEQALEYMKTDQGAAESAVWYWLGMPDENGHLMKKNLNLIADRDTETAFRLITKLVNGAEDGPNTHLQRRLAIWRRAQAVLTEV